MVAAASYEARKFGVHSAMASVTARRRWGHDKSSSQVSGISEQTVNIDSAVPPQAHINSLASLSRIERLRTDPNALSGN